METFDEKIAFAEERRLIALHNTRVVDGGWGANFTIGGDGVVGCKHTLASRLAISRALTGHRPWSRGRKHTVESRMRMSKSQRGKLRTPQQRQRMREAAKRRSRPSVDARRKMRDAKLGKKLTFEHRKKIGDATRGKQHTADWNQKIKASQPNARRVEQLSSALVVNTFDSIAEASRQTGIANIGMCCRGVRVQAGGFKWRFASDQGTVDHG